MGEISRSLDGDLRPRGSSGPPLLDDSAPAAEAEPESVKVLVADDDPVILESLKGLLTAWDYDPIAVNNGSDALNLLSAHDGPSLAVLDWMLPDIAGPDICRRLRQSQSLRYLYLILLTGRDEANDLVEGLSAGADDYLRKPYNISELRA